MFIEPLLLALRFDDEWITYECNEDSDRICGREGNKSLLQSVENLAQDEDGC
jgi:hypothetical protein